MRHIRDIAEANFKGLIPEFFQRKWHILHGRDPLEDCRMYCSLEQKTETLLLSSFFTCMIGALFTVIRYIPDGVGKAPAFVVSNFWTCVAWLPLAINLALWIKSDIKFRRIRKVSHHIKYFEAVRTFFQVFGVTPSAEVGAMSEEELISAVAGALRSMARQVDLLEGFKRVAAMDEWRVLHTNARYWYLCEKTYDKYFPQKGDKVASAA